MGRSLSEAIETLRHRYGDGVLRHPAEDDQESTWLTEMPAIDERLAPGGLPRGRVTVLAAGHRGATGRLTLLQALAGVASRSMEVAYVDLVSTLDPGFLADMGAELGSCLVVTPGGCRWGEGLVMARALVGAGVPWLGVALGDRSPTLELWDHALSALVEMVWKRRAVCVVAAPTPLPRPLGHASSLTLACTMTGWHETHGDVAGVRLGLTAIKRRVGGGPAGSGDEVSLLLRYPRPFTRGEVVSNPTVAPVPVIITPAKRFHRMTRSA